MDDRESDNLRVGERHSVVRLLFTCQPKPSVIVGFIGGPTHSAFPLKSACLITAHAFKLALVAKNTLREARTAAALWSSRPGRSTSFSTCETVGVLRFNTLEREMMYL